MEATAEVIVHSNKFKTEKFKVAIETVAPNPWNPNVQSDAMFKKEVASIKELGLLGSILVRKINHTAPVLYQILDGEHRWKACKELGYTEITIESMGEIPDQTAKLLTIQLNNLRGKDDVLLRAKILEQLNADQLQLLPFTQEEIDNEKKLLTFDFSTYEEQRAAGLKANADKAVLLGLTTSERELWRLACKIAQEKEGKDERALFVGMLEFYLALRKKEIPEYADIKF